MEEGARKATSEAASAARDVMIQFDKAIRVYRMYDRANDLIRKFTEELDSRVSGFLSENGDLVVRVRPTAFDYKGERLTALGLDELALSLFRQGVTRFEFTKDFGRESLVAFLEILTTGLSTRVDSDDDLVTMLWREGISGFTYKAILGFAEAGEGEDEIDLDPAAVEAALEEEEEEPEDPGATGDIRHADIMERAKAVELPPDVREYIEPITDETPAELNNFVLEIVGETLLAPEVSDHVSMEDAEQLLRMTLQALLESTDLENLGKYIGFLRFLIDPKSAPGFRYVDAVRAVLDEGIGEAGLRALAGSIPDTRDADLSPLTQIVMAMGRDLKGPVDALASNARTEERREALEELLVEMCEADPAFLVERFKAASGGAAVRALKLVARIDEGEARKALAQGISNASPATRVPLVRAMVGLPELYSPAARGALLKMAEEGGSLRATVVDAFRRLQDRDVVRQLREWEEGKPFRTWERSEVLATYKALIALDPSDRALARVREILGRRSFFRRAALRELQASAARAVAVSDAPAARELLQAHREAKAEDVRKAVRAAIREIDSRRAAKKAAP
jgi:hypothetical protein